ncbi:hypothetical protein SARC_15622, partial [Sphaeroforma arctica JP610]
MGTRTPDLISCNSANNSGHTSGHNQRYKDMLFLSVARDRDGLSESDVSARSSTYGVVEGPYSTHASRQAYHKELLQLVMSNKPKREALVTLAMGCHDQALRRAIPKCSMVQFLVLHSRGRDYRRLSVESWFEGFDQSALHIVYKPL